MHMQCLSSLWTKNCYVGTDKIIYCAVFSPKYDMVNEFGTYNFFWGGELNYISICCSSYFVTT